MIRLTKQMSETIDKSLLKDNNLSLMDIPLENGLSRTVSIERPDSDPRFLNIIVVEKSPCKSAHSYSRLEFHIKVGPRCFPHALRSFHDGYQSLYASGVIKNKWEFSTNPELLEKVSDQSVGSITLVSFEYARSELGVVLDAIEHSLRSDERSR